MSDFKIAVSQGSPSNPGKIIRVGRFAFADLGEKLADMKARGMLHHGRMSAAEYRAADTKARAADKRSNWFTLAEFSGDRRVRADVVSVGAIGFDVEGQGITPDALRERLGSAEFFAVSSYGHLIEENEHRWRVVVRLSAPITDMRHFEAVRAHLAKQIGAESTEAAKDPSRLWYFPGCPRDMIEKHEAFYQGGEAFDVASVAVPVAEPATAAPVAQVAPLDAAELSAAASEVKRVLDRYRLPDGPGHRDEWLHSGMSAHHHTAGSEEGFAVWHEWSASQPGYASEEDCRTRWESFGRRKDGSAPRTLASLERAMRAQVGYTADELGFDVVPGADTATWIEPLTGAAGQAYETAQTAIASAAADQPDEEIILQTADATETTDVWQDNYIVKGWLWRGIDAQIFGPTNAGKTFLSLHLGVHVAAGAQWFGQRVRQGGVLYLPYEGVVAIPRRLAALRKRYPDLPWSTMPFAWVGMNAPLVADRVQDQNTLPGRKRLQGAILKFTAKYGEPPALVIVDTYSRAIGGSASDEGLAGKFASMARALSDRYGATTLRVHHPGHDNSQRARGSYAIGAGLDVDIRVAKGLIEAPKQRDAEKNRLGFTLDVVQLGVDQDGDAITSCAAAPAEIPPEFELKPAQQAALDVILATAGSGQVAARKSVLDALRKAGLVAEGGRGSDRARELFEQLAARQRIAFDAEKITVLERGASGVFDD